MPEDWRREFADGRELGRRFRPIDRVGVYVPGGSAAYPSSAIMGVVPAVVAGVDHVAVVTPPAEEISPATLAAIYAAGADVVYQVGVHRRSRVSPTGRRRSIGSKNRWSRNKWVTAAKAVVRGDVEIDFLAGPSEVVVVADETADPELVAAELLAQAEHDPNTSVVAVTDDEATADAITTAVTELVRARAKDVIREHSRTTPAASCSHGR